MPLNPISLVSLDLSAHRRLWFDPVHMRGFKRILIHAFDDLVAQCVALSRVTLLPS